MHLSSSAVFGGTTGRSMGGDGDECLTWSAGDATVARHDGRTGLPMIPSCEVLKRLGEKSMIINAVVENGRMKLDLPRILVLHVLLDVTPFLAKHKHLLVFVLIARPVRIPMLVLLKHRQLCVSNVQVGDIQILVL